jgi:hypothetical protein
MQGIDNKVLLNLDLVRTVQPDFISGTEKGCHTIKVKFLNGDYFNYRYETEKQRDQILIELPQ